MDSVDKPHSGVDSSQKRHGQLMDKAWITPAGVTHTLPTTCPHRFRDLPHLHKTGLTHPAHIPGGCGGLLLFPISLFL